MKRMFFPFAALMILTACNNSARVASTSDSTSAASAQPDTAQARKEVTDLMDAVHNGFHQKDFSSIDKSMTPDAMVLGTDPKEVWPYSQFRDSLKKTFADTSFHGMKYDVPAHQVTIHGSSAIIIDQYQLNAISNKMMTRNIAHARYENGKWLLDLFSFNLVPTNQDIPKLNKAL